MPHESDRKNENLSRSKKPSHRSAGFYADQNREMSVRANPWLVFLLQQHYNICNCRILGAQTFRSFGFEADAIHGYA